MIFIVLPNIVVWSSRVGKGLFISLLQLDLQHYVCTSCVCISITAFFRLPRKTQASSGQYSVADSRVPTEN